MGTYVPPVYQPAYPNRYGVSADSQWALMTYNGLNGSGQIPTTYQYYRAVSDFNYSPTFANASNGLTSASGLVTVNITSNTTTAYENNPTSGVSTSVTIPLAPSPWGRINTGLTTYWGNQMVWSFAAGTSATQMPTTMPPGSPTTGVTITLKPGDLTNPPLMSDLTMVIPAAYKFGTYAYKGTATTAPPTTATARSSTVLSCPSTPTTASRTTPFVRLPRIRPTSMLSWSTSLRRRMWPPPESRTTADCNCRSRQAQPAWLECPGIHRLVAPSFLATHAASRSTSATPVRPATTQNRRGLFADSHRPGHFLYARSSRRRLSNVMVYFVDDQTLEPMAYPIRISRRSPGAGIRTSWVSTFRVTTAIARSWRISRNTPMRPRRRSSSRPASRRRLPRAVGPAGAHPRPPARNGCRSKRRRAKSDQTDKVRRRRNAATVFSLALVVSCMS